MNRATVVGVVAAVAGAALLIAPVATAATDVERLGLSEFEKRFSVAAHRFDVSSRNHAVNISANGADTYFAPDGEREITREEIPGSPELGSEVWACSAPEANGYMACLVQRDGMWSTGGLFDRQPAGWLTPAGYQVSEFSQYLTDAAKAERKAGGTYTLTRKSLPTGTQFRLVTTKSDGTAGRVVTLTASKRAVKVTERVGDEAPEVVALAKRVPQRPLTTPSDEVIDPGWG